MRALHLPLFAVLSAVVLAGCGPGTTRTASHPTHKPTATTVPPRGEPQALPGALSLYLAKCAVCHGRHAEGGIGPPLDSPAVLSHFGHSEAKLARFIQQNMPYNNPRTLTASQADLLAKFIWRLSTHRGGR